MLRLYKIDNMKLLELAYVSNDVEDQAYYGQNNQAEWSDQPA